MSYFEKRRQRREDSRQLEQYEAEVNAQYERPFGLGITPDDIQSYLAPAAVGAPKSKLVNGLLISTLKRTGARKIVSSEQREFLTSASIQASQTLELENDHKGFFNAYTLYLAILRNSGRLKTRLPYCFEEMATLTPDLGQAAAVRGLARYGTEQVPLLPETAQRVFTLRMKSNIQNSVDQWHGRDTVMHNSLLAAAGVGLAFTHSYAFMTRELGSQETAADRQHRQ